MCLGVPGKIINVYETDGLRMGLLDFNGIQRETCLMAVPEAYPGDYVLVHAGFAISQINPEDAQETQNLLNEIDSLD